MIHHIASELLAGFGMGAWLSHGLSGHRPEFGAHRAPNRGAAWAAVMAGRRVDGSLSGGQYTFSILSAANAQGCTPPANGRGVVDMYSVCPLRVTQSGGGKSHTQEFPEYCHLYPSPPAFKGDVTQTQMAFDAKSMMAYFRIIQRGKHVPACDRILRIK
jgi:hypothetical protein